MAKTKEQLDALRQEYINLKDKFKELSEEELKTIFAAGTDYTILPKDSEFWRTWNPFISNFIKEKDNLGILNNKTNKDLVIEHVFFTGNVSNRDDK